MHDEFVYILGKHPQGGHQSHDAHVPALAHAAHFAATEDLPHEVWSVVHLHQVLRIARNVEGRLVPGRLALGRHVQGADVIVRALAGPHLGTHLGNHVIHHVVRHVAMERPVADIVGDEFDLLRLRHAGHRVVLRNPCRFRYAPTLRAGHPESMAVQVDGVMLHRTEVQQPDAQALPVLAH